MKKSSNKKFRKTILMMLAMAVMLAMFPGQAMAAGKSTDKVTVNFSAGVPGSFDYINESLKVTGDLVEKYYPEAAQIEPEGVSFADAMVAAHIAKYGEKAMKDKLSLVYTADYGGAVSVYKQFGHDITGMYYVNNEYLMTNVSQATVKNKDKLYAGAYEDYDYANTYAYFAKDEYSVTANKGLSLVLTTDAFGTADTPVSGEVFVINKKSGAKISGLGKLNKGKVTVKFSKPGTYFISSTGMSNSSKWVDGPVAIQKAYEGALAKVTVKKSATPAKPVKLTKPAWFKGKRAGNKYVLSWSKVKGATSYQKQVKRTTAKKWKALKRGKKLSATKFRTIKADKWITYQYRVRAVRKAGGKVTYGPWSKVRSIRR